jgi:hypothetical protein
MANDITQTSAATTYKEKVEAATGMDYGATVTAKTTSSTGSTKSTSSTTATTSTSPTNTNADSYKSTISACTGWEYGTDTWASTASSSGSGGGNSLNNLFSAALSIFTGDLVGGVKKLTGWA